MANRKCLAVACLVVLVAGGVRSEDDPEPARASAERVLELARRYEFYTDAAKSARLELHPKSLLQYSNPVRGEVYGDVFVWTAHGRPEVVGAIFDFRSEDKLDSELHTLTRGGILGARDGKEFWNPLQPGVTMTALKSAPAPAKSESARLRQMRELARRFTVHRNHPEQKSGDMRLLTQPVYRYVSRETGVLDGALFVFVEGTDPEAFLLLEASGEMPTWQFGFARMNIVEFEARFDDQPVWNVKDVSWDTVFDKQEPYAIIRESPSRGLTRTR